MNDVLKESLYSKDKKQFEVVQAVAKEFLDSYCGKIIIGNSIFGVVENYARKKELSLEVLRYPFQDDELWAFTFVKKGTIFLCVNSDLAMCKQFFAVAHELYHIQCYAEDTDRSTIASGSLVNANTVDDTAKTQEDLEANAFAGLLLMSDVSMQEQLPVFGLQGGTIRVDDVLLLMDLFALPYKAVVLRLYEGDNISEDKANELLGFDSDFVQQRIELTGKAKQWQLDSREIEHFGSLMDNLEYNTDFELLTDSRESSDREYLQKIKKGFRHES